METLTFAFLFQFNDNKDWGNVRTEVNLTDN